MKLVKKTGFFVGMHVAILIAVLNFSLVSRAQENNKLEETVDGRLMTAVETIEAWEMPEPGAKVIFSFDKGAVIFITGETQDGWYIVSYQGKTGYIKKDAAGERLKQVEMDIEALNMEMETREDENRMIVEETERYRAEARRSKIWGAIIVLLIIGIFATGVIATIQAETIQKRKKEEEGQNDEIKVEQELEIVDLDSEA